MHLKMIPQMLHPKIIAPLNPVYHIHWEISNLPTTAPTPPTPWKIGKRRNIKLMKKLQSAPPPPNAPYAPESDTSNDSAQNSVSTDSYLTYSLRNIKFPSYFLNTTKTGKRRKIKLIIKLQSTPTLPPTLLVLIPTKILTKMLYLLTLILHIHQYIVNLSPTQPPPWKSEQEWK